VRCRGFEVAPGGVPGGAGVWLRRHGRRWGRRGASCESRPSGLVQRSRTPPAPRAATSRRWKRVQPTNAAKNAYRRPRSRGSSSRPRPFPAAGPLPAAPRPAPRGRQVAWTRRAVRGGGLDVEHSQRYNSREVGRVLSVTAASAVVAVCAVGVASGGGFVRQTPLAPAGATGAGKFGQAIDLSSDGTQMLVSAPFDNPTNAAARREAGAVWAFSRSGATWTQTAKLTGLTATVNFGWATALSCDGSTALVAGLLDHVVHVFSRAGGTWIRTGGISVLGDPTTLAISCDGSTAIVPTFADPAVFTRDGAAWRQTGTLPANAAGGGVSSAALSADGSTAVIGLASGPSSGDGFVYAYTRGAAGWARSERITSPAPEPMQGVGTLFGHTVGLSGDGNTVVIGSPWERVQTPERERLQGSAWVFARTPAGAWQPQAPKLRASPRLGISANLAEPTAYPPGTAGWSVDISTDGNTILVGTVHEPSAFGARFAPAIFTRAGGVWSQSKQPAATVPPGTRTPVTGGSWPRSNALSGDGSTVALGDWDAGQGLGSVETFRYDASALPARTRCLVPRLKGLALSTATRALTKVGCTLGRVRQSYSSSLRGAVLVQTPAAGAVTESGVDVVVSRGAKPRRR
jgi:hypothetical protein